MTGMNFKKFRHVQQVCIVMLILCKIIKAKYNFNFLFINQDGFFKSNTVENAQKALEKTE